MLRLIHALSSCFLTWDWLSYLSFNWLQEDCFVLRSLHQRLKTSVNWSLAKLLGVMLANSMLQMSKCMGWFLHRFYWSLTFIRRCGFCLFQIKLFHPISPLTFRSILVSSLWLSLIFNAKNGSPGLFIEGAGYISVNLVCLLHKEEHLSLVNSTELQSPFTLKAFLQM